MRADRTDQETVDDLVELYAIDALDASETAVFEAALAELDAESRRAAVGEIRRTRDAVGRMAAEYAADPGPAVRVRIIDAVRDASVAEDVRSSRAERPGDPGPTDELAVRRDRRRRAVVAASSAAAVLILVFAGVVVGRSTAPDASTTATAPPAQSAQFAQLRDVVSSPDVHTRRSTLVAAPGSVIVTSSRARNTAVVLLEGALQPPSSEVYQLWLIGGQHAPRSAGLITRSGTDAVVVDGLTDSDTIGMTVEPDGGSAQPTGTMLAAVTL